MGNRVCPNCGRAEENEPDEFGLGNRIQLCWPCHIAKQKAYKQTIAYKQRQAIYYREWYRKNGRRRASDYSSVTLGWAESHPVARVAGRAVTRAVRDGVLSRPDTCTLCRRVTRVVGHHEDYTKNLDVEWVCASCHKKIHSSEKGDLTTTL